MPDEVASGLAQLLGGRRGHAPEIEVGEDFETLLDQLVAEPARNTKSVLVYGAGPGTFAAAVDAICDSESVSLTEVDCVDSEREHGCVKTRHPSLGSVLDENFDALIWHLPAPAGEGATKHRYMYYGDTRGRPVPFDPGRLGQTAWKKWLQHFVAVSSDLVRNDGVLVLYLPTGVRTRTGYHEALGLLEGLEAQLEAANFEVTHDVLVHETGFVSQPFVAKARCPWRLVVARQGGSS